MPMTVDANNHSTAIMLSPTSVLKVFYNTFIKSPFSFSRRDGGQQAALESFYKDQADAHDSTRTYLLRGREQMLSLAAEQLNYRVEKGWLRKSKGIWIDIGGGTGANIEAMSKFISVPEFFETVILVDLSPSLLEVARKRFARLGWKNVKIVCQDVRKFRLENHLPADDLNGLDGDTKSARGTGAELITMSYSLTMIPDFFPVIDKLSGFLSPCGVIGAVDFYVQNVVDMGDRNYTADVKNRHVNALSRMFWRAWFELDRVHLEPARRDYLEYKFASILNLNLRNWYLGGIAHYIWIGCPKGLPIHWDTVNAEDAQEGIELIAECVLSERGSQSPGSKPWSNAELFRMAMSNFEAGLPLPSIF